MGIDVIDGRLSEINVTSPTGIREVERLAGIPWLTSPWRNWAGGERGAAAVAEAGSGQMLRFSAGLAGLGVAYPTAAAAQFGGHDPGGHRNDAIAQQHYRRSCDAPKGVMGATSP